MQSFWKELPRPFFALAPMADVTDAAYRRLIAETGQPDITWTEFVSADGLYYTREKKGVPDAENPLMRDLQFAQIERPIVAQFFSSKPDMIRYVSELAAQLGFDGIDINMGCPVDTIQKQCAGAALMKTPDVAVALIHAAREGVARAGRSIPVSLKTRTGYNQESLAEWLPPLLEAGPDALTVHLRTRKEMSKVEAHWELMPIVVALRDRYNPEVLVLGNGDVKDLADARRKAEESGADGIMLGRAIFGNPWLFSGRDPESITPDERLQALRTLAQYFSELTPPKPFHLLKKHFKAFVSGWPGASELRARLMQAESLSALEIMLSDQG